MPLIIILDFVRWIVLLLKYKLKTKIMYDLIDEICAVQLGVDVDEYINKIESTTEWRMEVIVLAILSEDENLLTKAKRIFKKL
jgi:hypothetical protein